MSSSLSVRLLSKVICPSLALFRTVDTLWSRFHDPTSPRAQMHGLPVVCISSLISSSSRSVSYSTKSRQQDLSNPLCALAPVNSHPHPHFSQCCDLHFPVIANSASFACHPVPAGHVLSPLGTNTKESRESGLGRLPVLGSVRMGLLRKPWGVLGCRSSLATSSQPPVTFSPWDLGG